MPWLFPAVITTLAGSTLLSLTYWAFYSIYRKPYLFLWAASWSVYSLRYVFQLLLLIYGPDPFLTFGNFASIAISLFLLYRGTVVFLGENMARAWNFVFAALLVWPLIGLWADFSFLLLTIPLFGVMAWINIWVGWIILRSPLPKGVGKTVVGGTFIVWGLHRLDYPFLRTVEWFAPIGYLIATVCAVTIAFGMILLFFRKMSIDLEAKDAQLQQLFDDAIYGIALADPDTGIIADCNRAFARMLGRSKEEIVGRPEREFNASEEDASGLSRIFLQHSGEKRGDVLESRMLTAAGDLIDVEIQAGLVEVGDKRYLQGFFRDVSERKQARQALRDREDLSRLILDSAAEGIFGLDQNGRCTFCNQSCIDLLGYTSETDLLGVDMHQLIHHKTAAGDSLPVGNCRIYESFQSGREIHLQQEALWRSDGAPFPAEIWSRPVLKGGNVIGAVVSFIDISARLTTAEKLRISEEKYRALYENAPLPYQSIDEQGFLLDVNPAWLKLLGYDREEVLGKSFENFLDPEWKVAFHRNFAAFKNQGSIQKAEFRLKRKDGSGIDISLDGCIGYQRDGSFHQTYCVFYDITDRRRAEAQVKHHKDLLEKSQQLGHIGTWEYDIEQDHLVWTDEIHRIFCIPFGTELNYGIFMRRVHPDDREEVDRKWKAALEGEPYDLEHRLLIGEETRWVRQKANLEFRYADQPVRAIGFVQDITDLKQAEKKREELESQLRQAQKIESVGRLAGGVAHDYNNMLGVIIGYAELAQMKVAVQDPLHEDLEQILAAARRSRDVTRKLLAFARKQTLVPQVVDLNAAVENMLKMLRKLLGEQIELAWQPLSQLWHVKIDPSQLDQILTNLCVNARDAIEDTGKIAIYTGQTYLDQAFCDQHPGYQPGEYVVLTVKDNGRGMDRQTLENIYEPFFTTKPDGSGTGLGLATVYGIVKQSNGYIEVSSEAGEGTTFTIYLPRYAGQLENQKLPESGQAPRGRGETVLVVEDEQAILKLTQALLENLGYRALVAGSPTGALDLAQKHAGEIHLLLTDVIMPEMNGRELANRLRAMYPGLKCLYMSGYTGDAIAHHGILDKGVHFIPKPFSRDDLAERVRQVMQNDA